MIDAPLLFDVPLGVTLASIELHDSPFSAGVVLPLPDAVSVVAAPPGASQDSSVAAPPPFPGEPISIADRQEYSADVLWLQLQLVGRGYSVDADGHFGPQTRDAVIDFQSRNGLSADGVVGAATWNELAAG